MGNLTTKLGALFFFLVCGFAATVNAESLSTSALADVAGRTLTMFTHPTLPNKLWAGTVHGGLWQSEDGGHLWTSASEQTQGMSITTIVMHPLNSNMMFAGSSAGDKETADQHERGLFKSEDGGHTWSLLKLTNPAVVGDNWNQINHVAISTTGVLLVSTSDKDLNGFIYRSTDGGGTWGLFPVYIGSTIGPHNTIHTVKFDPDNPNGAIFMDKYANVTLSSDGGLTWQLVRKKSSTCK
jgi:hypothetical protein